MPAIPAVDKSRFPREEAEMRCASRCDSAIRARLTSAELAFVLFLGREVFKTYWGCTRKPLWRFRSSIHHRSLGEKVRRSGCTKRSTLNIKLSGEISGICVRR